MTPEVDAKRQHAARMFAWEDAVVRDRGLNRFPHATRIVVLLRKRMSAEGEDVSATADHRWLAEALGISVSTVQRTIAALEERGHLKVVSRKADGMANVYQPRPGGSRRGPKAGEPGSVTDAIPPSGVSSTGDRPGQSPVRRRVGHTRPTRSSSSPSSYSGKRQPRESRRLTDYGAQELALAKRLGADWMEILGRLPDHEREALCDQQRAGTLSDQALHAVRVRYLLPAPAAAAGEAR